MRLWLLIVLIWFAPAVAAHAGEETVDLKLVLAVDASGSVDDDEYRLQVEGIANAFRDPEIREAIHSGPHHRIAVCLITWAQHEIPKQSTGWFVIAGDGDAARFAEAAAKFPRNTNGATGMGEGLAWALRFIEGAGIAAPREVVDISGDGAETPARDYVVMMPQARMMAFSRGVNVNGLVILGEDGVENWYRRNVLVGDGSFLVVARDYADFQDAVRRKLLREIEHRPRLSVR